MVEDGLRVMKMGWMLGAVLASLGLAVGAHAADECLVQFETQENGTATLLGETDQMCGVASDKTCTFQLGVCVNVKASDCTTADLKKRVKAKGKKGCKVKKLFVQPSGTSSVCGSFVGVVVKAKRKGTVERTCTVSATAKSGKGSSKRTDTDTITLTCMPTTATCPTTTTTSPTTTTTTIPPCPRSVNPPCTPPAGSLAFTTSPGTTSCGGAGLNPAPAAPASGEIDSDTGGTTKIADLGLGCLYFGGGAATIVPPGLIPDGATSYFEVSGGTLTATPACAPVSCTKGAGPGKHCINAHCNSDADCDNGTTGSCPGRIACQTGTQCTPLTCTNDNDCGGSAGSCALDANCYFGPPLPVLSPPPQGALTTCVLNVVQSDGSGTTNTVAGTSTVDLPLSSRVYITGNTASPCPKCVAGKCNYGERAGGECSTTTSLGTTLDCLPPLKNFQAPLPVDLNPLTTGTSELTDAGGHFCSGAPGFDQTTNGAFGHPDARRIAETGMPGGDLTDNMPHHSILGAAFCIPGTGNPAVDGVADLPGPGAIGLNGNAQLIP